MAARACLAARRSARLSVSAGTVAECSVAVPCREEASPPELLTPRETPRSRFLDEPQTSGWAHAPADVAPERRSSCSRLRSRSFPIWSRKASSIWFMTMLSGVPCSVPCTSAPAEIRSSAISTLPL
eukprot:scaffold84463_cov72-Phaeocystis_antarctica.AAC.3